MKQCTKCKRIFDDPERYFHKNASTKDGYNYWCKKCSNEYNQMRVLKKRQEKYKDRTCQECGGPIPILLYSKRKTFCSDECMLKNHGRQLEHRKHAPTFDAFLEERCVLDDAVFIRYKDLLEAYNAFLVEKKKKKIGHGTLWKLLEVRGLKREQHGTRKLICLGVTLKTKRSGIGKSLELDEIDHASACRMMSCSPTVQLLENVVKKNEIELDLEKARAFTREIEKVLFKKNVYRSPMSKVATILYVMSPLTQREAGSVMGLTPSTIRATLRLFRGAIPLDRYYVGWTALQRRRNLP